MQYVAAAVILFALVGYLSWTLYSERQQRNLGKTIQQQTHSLLMSRGYVPVDGNGTFTSTTGQPINGLGTTFNVNDAAEMITSELVKSMNASQ